MTLKNVYSLLLSSGYPVAYRDYTGEVKKEIPKPPFMVYSVLDTGFDGGDMRKFIREQNINVELYTDGKNLEAEEAIDRLLIDLGPEKYESMVDEGFALIRYTFTIRDYVPRKEGNLNG